MATYIRIWRKMNVRRGNSYSLCGQIDSMNWCRVQSYQEIDSIGANDDNGFFRFLRTKSSSLLENLGIDKSSTGWWLLTWNHWVSEALISNNIRRTAPRTDVAFKNDTALSAPSRLAAYLNIIQTGNFHANLIMFVNLLLINSADRIYASFQKQPLSIITTKATLMI